MPPEETSHGHRSGRQLASAVGEAPKLFISYRREDTKPASRLIYERLSAHFGTQQVFFDIDNIPPGVDFVEHLNEQVARCDVLIAVIGERWTLGKKIFEDDDFVRIEICAALDRRIPVIPIFVDGAEPPQPHQVPASLQPFLRRQGLPVDTGRDLNNHIQAVIRHAVRLAKENQERVQREAAAARVNEQAKQEEIRRQRESERVRREEQSRAAHATRLRSNQQQFVILRRLEFDGLTELFLAESRGIEGFKKRVLIRRLVPHLADRAAFVDQFLEEARLAGHLNHANIHSIIDVGSGANTYFCVYEYLDFQSLREITKYQIARQSLSARLGLEPLLAVHICREVCRALEYAHGATLDGHPLGIVHRDVSPSNIYVVHDGRIVLSSFGLAKAATQLEQTDPDLFRGKFSYLSPEVASGAPATPQSDLFSLGIVLWELLAGRRLFLGDNDLATVRMVRRAQWPSLREVQSEHRGELDEFFPHLSSEWRSRFDDVLSRFLARDPKERFANAGEARRALEDVLRDGRAYVTPDTIAAIFNRFRTLSSQHDTESQSLIDRLIQEEIEFTSVEQREPAALEPASALRLDTPPPAIQTPSPPVVQTTPAPVPWRKLGMVALALLTPAVILWQVLVDGSRAETGSIEVRTTPGVLANVTLEGVYRGHAPLRLGGVPVGTRSVSVDADGYLPVNKQVEVRSGDTTQLEVALVAQVVAAPAPLEAPPPVEPLPTSTEKPQARDSHAHEKTGARGTRSATPTHAPAPADPDVATSGTLMINTVPWSLVSIDGRDTGRTTPLLGYRIAVGAHELRLQTADGQVHVEHIEVQPEQTVSITRRF